MYIYTTIRLRWSVNHCVYSVNFRTNEEIVYPKGTSMEAVINQLNDEGFFVTSSEESGYYDETIYMTKRINIE